MALGHTPTKDTLQLSQHADFIHRLAAPGSSPYPADFTARIEILTHTYGLITTWNPVASSAEEVAWNVQADIAVTGVDAVIAAGAKKFRLYAIFPSSPTDDYLWYFGQININK